MRVSVSLLLAVAVAVGLTGAAGAFAAQTKQHPLQRVTPLATQSIRSPRTRVRRFYAGPFRPHPGARAEEPPIRVLITSPTEPGRYPAMVFLSGMFGLVPTFWYNHLMGKIAEKGVIVMALDLALALPTNYRQGAEFMRDTVVWAQTEEGRFLSALLERSVAAGVSFSGSVVLAGHSSGAQSVVYAFRHGLGNRTDALVLLDPVDSFPKPPGSNATVQEAHIGSFPTAAFPPLHLDLLWNNALPLVADGPVIDPADPDQFRNVHTPLLILSSGLCHVSPVQIPVPNLPNLPPIFQDQDSLWPACCPKHLGPERFYRAFTGSNRWNVNTTAFGHCDLLSDAWTLTNRVGNFCKTNLGQSPEVTLRSLAVLRGFLAEKVDQFLRLSLKKDCRGREELEKGDSHGLRIVLSKEYWNLGTCVGGSL